MITLVSLYVSLPVARTQRRELMSRVQTRTIHRTTRGLRYPRSPRSKYDRHVIDQFQRARFPVCRFKHHWISLDRLAERFRPLYHGKSCSDLQTLL